MSDAVGFDLLGLGETTDPFTQIEQHASLFPDFDVASVPPSSPTPAPSFSTFQAPPVTSSQTPAPITDPFLDFSSSSQQTSSVPPDSFSAAFSQPFPATKPTEQLASNLAKSLTASQRYQVLSSFFESSVIILSQGDPFAGIALDFVSEPMQDQLQTTSNMIGTPLSPSVILLM